MDAFPSGAVIAFAGRQEKIPDGWHECDGTSLDRNQFQSLFDAIGTMYGGVTETQGLAFPITVDIFSERPTLAALTHPTMAEALGLRRTMRFSIISTPSPASICKPREVLDLTALDSIPIPAMTAGRDHTHRAMFQSIRQAT